MLTLSTDLSEDERLPRFELTARARFFGQVFGPTAKAKFVVMPDFNYQKLWLKVLLSTVAEQDPANVVLKNTGKAATQRRREKLAQEAREAVVSSDFELICESAGIDVETARAMSPEAAKLALDVLNQAEREPQQEQPEDNAD